MLDPRINILGNSSIGIFGFSTESYTLLPNSIKPHTLDTISKILGTSIIQSTIADTSLIGLFGVGNTGNLLLPHIISETEYNEIKSNGDELGISVNVLNSKITALGNTIVSSDKVALVHKDFSTNARRSIADYLDVEVEIASFIDSSLLGSIIFLSNIGFLTHPLLPEEDIDWLSRYFAVPGDVVTVNRGLPYPRLGIIANSKGILVGSDTTGPEILRITEVLNS